MWTPRTIRTRAVPFLLPTLLLLAAALAAAAPATVKVVDDADGQRLLVDGEPMMVFGMNWGYMPIGQNYSYDFWGHDDDFIKAALAREMPLLQEMGVNVIRHYNGMPARWVEYVYDTYGIWTVINHPLGRYGLTIDGVWTPSTDYSDPKTIAQVRAEMKALAEEFRGTRGMLMWLLGNENNYGLHWSSFEIEALPQEQRADARARHLYKLFGTVIDDLHAMDPARPVAMANGDLGYIDIIAEECANLDVFGTNVYRGISARDLYQVVKAKLGKPVMYTEFGSDAFNAVTMSEDQAMQAKYLLGQWQEIYEQSAGKGRVGNCIGGMIFQWSDGWWKFRQEERLDIHDTNASWPNAGYPDDYLPGENNMNEEWWGICAKGYTDVNGLYEVYPRAAYYALRDAFELDPYAPTTDLTAIRKHFRKLHPAGAVLQARGDAGALKTSTLDRVRLSGLRMEFTSYATGGKNVTTPDDSEPASDGFPSYRGYDNGESYYADFEAKPNDAVLGRLSLNMLGRVPVNPIDEIFYENRGRPVEVENTDGETVDLTPAERIQVYQASVNWDDRWFMLDAFYRVGHLHWQYEGDFFGLYRDAYYGPNLDIYNGVAPVGMEIAGKRSLNGLKVAVGPQLWWGANPAMFVKYQRRFLDSDWTFVVQEDFTQRTETSSSLAVPVQVNRKASVQLQRRVGPFDFEGGVLWAGQPRVGDEFQLVDDALLTGDAAITPADIKSDTVKDEDTFGVKAKLMYEKGRWHWYGQGAYMGLVADGGATMIPTYTGWTLKDSGSGNQVNAISGVAVNVGDWQIGPNLLWQKPIVGPMPHSTDLAGTQGRPRNWTEDPFSVIWNRETTAAELMVTYDPTPATWLWSWDSDQRENADFAASVGLVWKRHHTTSDARPYYSDTGAIFFFPGGTPARDLWEVNSRIVNRVGDNARMVSHILFGQAEPNGDNTRLIKRVSVDTRVAFPRIALGGALKFNDFGPYDYHRDFNLTYPLQVMGDVSYNLGRPGMLGLPQTKVGVRLTYRTLDRYSPRYAPEGAVAPEVENELYPEGLDEGREWEIRTYLHMVLM
ncbi:MAG TPA: glycoside hydrolase family 2 TIM barrel-domain containing protein [Candidatus Krumholzibacteria bacterium]|nr:glycoside hydrolase family 2 TIM barrel-domain containing protein [Candidatus Krumholzibacteria bacterium]HRX51406.1 glycoside hydrolase family 2 TIM barrel-domain containing protein [Candidatus Krumholzibacteria bacterium]